MTHPEDGVTLPLGFEPLFNQHLLPPTFQREHKLLPDTQEVQKFWLTLLKEFKQLTKLPQWTDFSRFFEVFELFRNKQKNTLKMSLKNFQNNNKKVKKTKKNWNFFTENYNGLIMKMKILKTVERLSSVFGVFSRVFWLDTESTRAQCRLQHVLNPLAADFRSVRHGRHARDFAECDVWPQVWFLYFFFILL